MVQPVARVFKKDQAQRYNRDADTPQLKPGNCNTSNGPESK